MWVRKDVYSISLGSEVYGAVTEGRKGIGVELKPSYYRQAVKNLDSIGKEDIEETSLFEEPLNMDEIEND